MKDAFWFRHDSNAARDPKMMRLTAKYGCSGYGAFWRLIEFMRDQEGGVIHKQDIEVLAVEIREPNLQSIVSDCVLWSLFVECDDYYKSERLCREIESYRRQRQRSNERMRNKRERDASRKRHRTVSDRREDREDIQRRQTEKKEYAPLVSMTEEEHRRLIDDFGEKGTTACIEKLSAYKGANGKRYKSDYLAIRNWVIEALKLAPRSRAAPSVVCPVCGTAPAGTESFCRKCGLERASWKDTAAVADARQRWQKEQTA